MTSRSRSVAIIGVALASLAPRLASAQSPWRCDVGGGAAFPLAPSALADVWSPGFALAGAIRVRATPRLLVGPEFGYTRFGFDRDAFEAVIEPIAPQVNVSGNDLHVFSVVADAEYALVEWGNTRPFARAAAGWARAGTTTARASGPNAAAVEFPTVDGDAFSLRLGAGMRTVLRPALTLFADAAWQVAWFDPDPLHFVPVRVGLRF